MDVLSILKDIFEKNMQRHSGLLWIDVYKKLENNESKLNSLKQLEETGGEPDVIGYDKDKDEFIFVDCSKETPGGRRSICYDNEALISRKKFPPKDSSVGLANKMVIELLSVDDYHKLQELGEFDLKTSSWVATPDKIRKLGGALFCDRRYDTIFTYHNGADSYYSSRGFRGKLRV